MAAYWTDQSPEEIKILKHPFEELEGCAEL